MGTSRTLKLLLAGDPAIEANAGIVHFWAGAVWRACGPIARRRRTDPTPNLLDAAVRKAERGLADAGYLWENVKGPAGAFIMTTKRLGWRVLSGFRLEDERGEVIDMGVTDPRGVRTAAERATRSAAAARAATKEGLSSAGDGVWIAPVQRVLSSKRVPPAAKAALRRAFTGGYWTGARRMAAGIAEFCICPLCGGLFDDLFHRIWECTGIADQRAAHTTDEMRDAAAAAPRDHPLWTRGVRVNPRGTVPPPRRDHDERWFFAPGVPEDRFFDGDVYTDGSAYNPQCPDIRKAGWAVVQLDADGGVLKAVYGHLPAAMSVDQTVAAGEVYALRRATELTAGTIHVRVDYQGIVDGCRAGEAACCSHRRPNAASWRPIWRATDGNAPRVTKVKAHRTRQEAEADPDPEAWTNWLGNRAADRFAKLGAASHANIAGRQAADKYELEFTQHVMLSKWIAIALSHWPRVTGTRRSDTQWRRAMAERRRDRRRHAAARHGHNLSMGRDGWNCLACGRGSSTWAGAKRLALSPCRGHTASRVGEQGLRPAAHTLWAAEAERTQTGYLPPDVIWCSRCGSYSSARVYNLGKLCKGVAEKSTRTQLLAFHAGTHPVTRHKLAPPVRLTDSVIAALGTGASRRRAAFNLLLRGDPTVDVRGADGRQDTEREAAEDMSITIDQHSVDLAAVDAPFSAPKRARTADGTVQRNADGSPIDDFLAEPEDHPIERGGYESEEDVFGHGSALGDAEGATLSSCAVRPGPAAGPAGREAGHAPVGIGTTGHMEHGIELMEAPHGASEITSAMSDSAIAGPGNDTKRRRLLPCSGDVEATSSAAVDGCIRRVRLNCKTTVGRSECGRARDACRSTVSPECQQADVMPPRHVLAVSRGRCPCSADGSREAKRRRIRGKHAPPLHAQPPRHAGDLHAASGPAAAGTVDQSSGSRSVPPSP